MVTKLIFDLYYIDMPLKNSILTKQAKKQACQFVSFHDLLILFVIRSYSIQNLCAFSDRFEFVLYLYHVHDQLACGGL